MRFRLVVTLIALGLATMPAFAAAHVLEKPRARNASNNQARYLCNHVQGCQRHKVRNCPRLSDHRVRCFVRTFFEDGINCEWTDEWFIRNSSSRLEYNKGVFHRSLHCHR
jgi:hypothetical protein